MKIDNMLLDSDIKSKHQERHPNCGGKYDGWNGDYDCDYDTTLTCEDCKYGVGRKDPEAKCNQI